jgi:hypothetical protein
LNELDAELRRLLAVTPSPQFEVSVRTRVSGERMARGWWSPPWRLAATAAAAAIVIALVSSALMLDTPSSPVPEPPPPNMAVRQPPPPVEPASPAPVLEPRQPQPRAAKSRIARRNPPVRMARAAAVTREPEVLVDPRQKVNVERLMRLARAGLLKAEDMPVMAPGAVDLVVEPLHIPAIGGVESKY